MPRKTQDEHGLVGANVLEKSSLFFLSKETFFLVCCLVTVVLGVNFNRFLEKKIERDHASSKRKKIDIKESITCKRECCHSHQNIATRREREGINYKGKWIEIPGTWIFSLFFLYIYTHTGQWEIERDNVDLLLSLEKFKQDPSPPPFLYYYLYIYFCGWG